jgi:hypothetical protein
MKKVKKNYKKHWAYTLLFVILVVASLSVFLSNKPKNDLSVHEVQKRTAIDNVLTNPSKYMSQEEKVFKVLNVPADTKFTKDWKEFKSNFYGYSLKYPQDWDFSSSIYEDPYDHTKYELTRIYSMKPVPDANTYFCLEIQKGPKGATQMSETAHTPFVAEVFNTLSGDQFAIFTQGLKNGSMTESSIRLVQNTSDTITYAIKTKRTNEFLTVSGIFDCVGGDKPLAEDIHDDFNTRPEVLTAKEILKSINFQH